MKVPVDRFDIEKIYRLYEAQDYSACLKLTKKVSERAGGMTGWLHWMCGVCEDMLGNPFNGLIHFKSAIATDPYNYQFLGALTANMNFLRHNLMNYLDGDGTLEDIEKVHRVLMEAGEFNTSMQYLVIKNYVVREEYMKAQEILSVYLMNNPKDDEALELEKIVIAHVGYKVVS